MVELSKIPREDNFRIDAINLDSQVDTGRFKSFLSTLPPPIEDVTELQLLMQSKPIVLQGMLFTMHFTGDDVLKAQTGNLDEATFNSLKNQLEDLMSQIDKNHARREGSLASSWEAMGSRLVQQENDISDDHPARSRSLKLRMFPRSFSNDLARIKEELVYQRLRNCIGIETYSSGRFKQMIYLLPYSNAPKMIKLVAEANTEIDKVNAEIRQYLHGEDYEQLCGILDEHKALSAITGKDWRISHVRYEVMPLALNTATVMEMVSQTDIKDAKLRKEYEEGMAILKQDLEAKSKEMATQVLGALKKEIDSYVRDVVTKMKTDPENVKASMAALKAKAASIGLETLAATVIEPLALVLDDPSKLTAAFGVHTVEQLPNEINDRVLALLKAL